MKIEKLTLEKALERAACKSYALITRQSELYLGPTPSPIVLDEILEARFFDRSGEIRFFDDGEGLTAAAVEDDGPDDPRLDDLTTPVIPSFGKSLTVRRYVNFDKDGQAFISAVRLLDWKGGNPNG